MYRKIAMDMDYETLLNYCLTSKYFTNIVCNDIFFYNKLEKDYPDTLKYNSENKNWKEYALEVIYYITKMKEIYGYNYKFGNPKVQYEILKNRALEDKYIEPDDEYDYDNLETKKHNFLLFDAVMAGEIALAEEALRKGADINADENTAIINAVEAGNLDMIKYLVNQGAIINRNVRANASNTKNPEIIKFLSRK